MGTALINQARETAIAGLDDIVAQANLQVVASYGQFKQALVMASAIRLISEKIDDSMMKDIVALQNTALGFRTDKQGQGYPVDVVRQCFVEAVLRGVRVVGNEFNIISGRVYITKEGFSRLVREYPGLTELKMTPSVPQLVGGGALVGYRSSWKLGGVPGSLARVKEGDEDNRIPVKVNQGMGSDAILGKATRKMYAAIYGVLTGAGDAVPDGEVDDATGPAAGARRSELNDELPSEGGDLFGDAPQDPTELPLAKW